MIVNTNMGVWHTVTGDLTGYYPVLAGFDASGTALYVHEPAANSYAPVFARVANGDSMLQIEGKNRNLSATKSLRVLGLRHDPSDIHPPYPCAPLGAMDPTGPIHWLAFWPKKDPEFPDNPFWFGDAEKALQRRGDEESHSDNSECKWCAANTEGFSSYSNNTGNVSQYSRFEDFRSPRPQASRALKCNTQYEPSAVGELPDSQDDELSDSSGSGSSDSESYYPTSDEDSGSDLDNTEPQYSGIEDFRSHGPGPTRALDFDEESGPVTDGPDGELNMLMEDGGSENQRLREELRRSQGLLAEKEADLRRSEGLVAEKDGELRRMQELLSKLQAEKSSGSDE